MIASVPEQVIKANYEALKPALDERVRPAWAATEARRLGPGGVALVARATGLAESTIRLGQRMYPQARQVLVTAAGGGSNGSRSRLGKVAGQPLSNATGLDGHVCHLPPGDEQMAQDRTSIMLPYHRKLARPSAGEP